MIFNKLGELIMKTADGCLVVNPPKLDILKIYVEVINDELSSCSDKFWKKCGEQLNVKLI